MFLQLQIYENGDVAQSIGVPNSNSTIGCSKPVLGIMRCCVPGKDT